VAIGNATDAGATAVALGNGAQATGTNSVAIGNGATTAAITNSVAHGAGSAATANNQVNVGNRTIAGVTAGVAATDAVNVGQLNAAIAGVGVDITGIEADIADLQAQDIILANNIHRVDRRAAGGTAVAIAMGGNAFLPDKTFNLTGNLGLYRSQLAGAVQLGAMISGNAAFNAAVGTGFNHNGKLGGRAGFSFGW
jgi:autotransporter adhesin